MKKLILASQSPRRKELLEKCGIPFICIPADIDESIHEKNDLKDEIKELAYRKAKHILDTHEDAVVLGSDTIVTMDGKILGKPRDDQEAFNMIHDLQGHTHHVITGLCLLSKDKRYSDVSVSAVTFSPMSDQEIWDYVSTGECKDKAGAYGIQGYGGKYISSIEGDYYAIMGLPLNMVYEALKDIESY